MTMEHATDASIPKMPKEEVEERGAPLDGEVGDAPPWVEVPNFLRTEDTRGGRKVSVGSTPLKDGMPVEVDPPPPPLEFFNWANPTDDGLERKTV